MSKYTSGGPMIASGRKLKFACTCEIQLSCRGEEKIHWLFSLRTLSRWKKRKKNKNSNFMYSSAVDLNGAATASQSEAIWKRAVCFEKRNEVWPWAFFEFSTLKIVYMCDLRECRRNQKFISHPPKSTWQVAVFLRWSKHFPSIKRFSHLLGIPRRFCDLLHSTFWSCGRFWASSRSRTCVFLVCEFKIA